MTTLTLRIIPVSHSYGFSNLIGAVARARSANSSEFRSDATRNSGRPGVSGSTVFPGMPVFYQLSVNCVRFRNSTDFACAFRPERLVSLSFAKIPGYIFQRPIHSFYGSSECRGGFVTTAKQRRETRVRRRTNEGGPAPNAARARGQLEPRARAKRGRGRRLFRSLTRNKLGNGE